GDAADCKSVHAGSIPARASTTFKHLAPLAIDQFAGRFAEFVPGSASREARAGPLSGHPGDRVTVSVGVQRGRIAQGMTGAYGDFLRRPTLGQQHSRSPL
ncbi:hypothetical protein, partial [Caulobacter sp.]|uniref:hypothetical protein n=1 Tax=Caulobacter sp. TaxID=78 RepID=UPI002B49B2E9